MFGWFEDSAQEYEPEYQPANGWNIRDAFREVVEIHPADK
jgi:hypothetical protein